MNKKIIISIVASALIIASGLIVFQITSKENTYDVVSIPENCDLVEGELIVSFVESQDVSDVKKFVDGYNSDYKSSKISNINNITMLVSIGDEQEFVNKLQKDKLVFSVEQNMICPVFKK